MHAPTITPQKIANAVRETLQGMQERRQQRRAYAEAHIPAAPPHAPPPRPPPGPSVTADDMPVFRPMGFVEMNGRAVQVMDPAFLESLQAKLAQGMAPPPAFFAGLMSPPARSKGSTTTDPRTSAAVHRSTNPELRIQDYSSDTLPFPKPAPPEPAGAPSPDASAPEKKTEAANKPPVRTTSQGPEPVHERRAEAETARLAALIRDHEHRLAAQAEEHAMQQAALLRQVLDAHREQQAEQAARHTQVIRDLIREHQAKLDEQATAAITREAQILGALLREHREALVEVHEVHRRDLEEVLGSHRDELRAARGTTSGDNKFRENLTEQIQLQHADHLQLTTRIAALTTTVERLGERVQQLAGHSSSQRDDLSWLPPPNLYPPLPIVPSSPAPVTHVVLEAPSIFSPLSAVPTYPEPGAHAVPDLQATMESPDSPDSATDPTPAASRPGPRLMSADPADETAAKVSASATIDRSQPILAPILPDETPEPSPRPSGSSFAERQLAQERELDRVRQFMDEAPIDLAPSAPLSGPQRAEVGLS